MRNIILLPLLLAFAVGGELEIGSSIPLREHRLPDIGGNVRTLSNVKGENGLLVIFSCNTCPWVIRWEDRYVSLAKKYTSRGIGMIAVNSNEAAFNRKDSMEEMQEHADENGYNFPYAQDPGSQLAYAFGATKTPHIYLFDKNDKLVYRGAIDDNAKNVKKVENTYLADAMDAMLSGGKIDPASTKALGCSIKFK